MVGQFLSPFINDREDKRGGDATNFFHLLKEILVGIRQRIGSKFLVLAKMNADDYIAEAGISPDLAVEYAAQLSRLGVVDGVEISGGATTWSTFAVLRGGVPAEELARFYPWPVRSIFGRRFENWKEQPPIC